MNISNFLFFVINYMKKKQLRKLSTKQKPVESFLWKLLKNGKRLLSLVLELTVELLIFWYYLNIKFFQDSWWGFIFFEYWPFRREIRVWFNGREAVFRCCLSLILLRWRCIGIRLAITLILNVDNIQKASVIYITTLHCIFIALWENKR